MAQAKQKSSQQAARKRRKPKATKAKSQNASTRSRSNSTKSKSRPAGGAVIAGAAGGAALASRQSHRHRGLANGIAHGVRKIDADDVARAAKRVGDATARAGQFAADFQRARESSNGAGNGNGKHRSPIEVVLQGLTTRR